MPEVRLVDSNGENVGVVATSHALKLAEDDGLDLVEVSPDASPPVCRIMNHGKFKYEKQKRQSEARKKQKVINVKEVRFRPTIDDHDYEVKIRAATKFLENGDKVKFSIIFRGREVAHQDIGMKLINKTVNILENFSKVDFGPRLEGRQITLILAPK